MDPATGSQACGIVLHAEAVPWDPAALRWVCPEGLPGPGRLVAAPGALGELLAPRGPIVRAVLERGALWTWLADDDWGRVGPAVRDAIAASAGQVTGWLVEPVNDEILKLVARDVLERGLGEFIASHGGAIRLVAVANGEIEVVLEGACAHCPAAGLTLHGRIEAAIRARVSDQVVVRSSGTRGPVQRSDRMGFGRWPRVL